MTTTPSVNPKNPTKTNSYMYKAILEKIEKYNSIVIFGHVNPDGDCYGSQLALRRALQLHYPKKKVYAVGSGLKRFFPILGKMDVIPEKVIEQSLAIIVDGNDIPRMEDQRIRSAKDFIKFDHHVDVGSFTEGPFIVREDATSCCEILLDFLRDNNFEIDKDVAQCLLLGLITDTARFQFVVNYQKIFTDSAYLCSLGANPDVLNSVLNQTSENAAAFKGYVYSHYKKTMHGVLHLYFSKNQLRKFKLTANAASGMVNLLSNIRGYPIWMFICENNNKSVHIEFRSNGPAVQPIALKYGGGGHALAAGVTITNPSKELFNQIIDELDSLAKKWKEEND